MHGCLLRRPPQASPPPSEKTPLPRQVQATPARAGAEEPGRLPPAGLAASRAPVLSPSGHRQCPPWGPPGPSLLAPPRRACRPCSGHSGSQGRVGTGARESSAWAPSGTERPLPDDSQSRPRRHKGPPEVPSRSCHPRREADYSATPDRKPCLPAHCRVRARGGRAATASPPPAGPPGEGPSRPAVGVTQAARAGAPLSPVTLRPAVHVPRVSGTPLHPGTLVSVALPRWAQPLQLQPGRPAPPIFRRLSRGSLAGGGGCPAFPRPCARPRGPRWGLRMALLPGLWDPGPLSCTVRGNTRPGPGDLGFPVTSWKYTSRRGFWGVCRCPRERPCVTPATRAEMLRGTKPQTSPRAGPGGASCPGPVPRRRVPPATDLRDPADARSLCPQALSLCAMRSPPCLAGLCPRCRARQTGRPRTLGVLSRALRSCPEGGDLQTGRRARG